MMQSILMKKRSFKMKLIIMISIFMTALVLAVSIFNYSWHSEQVIRQTLNQTQQIIDQTGVNIDNYVDELFRLTLAPYYNNEIMKTLSEKPANAKKALDKKRTIERFLESVMILPRDEILRVSILNENERYSYRRTPYDMEDVNTYQKSDWYLEALKTTKPIFIPVHLEKAYGDRMTRIFSIARKLRWVEDNNITLGVIKVDANYSGIKSICDIVQFENKGALFVVNENSEIVYKNNNLADENLLEHITFEKTYGDFIAKVENEDYIINVSTLQSSGMRVIAIHSYSELTKAARTNISKTIGLVSICMIVSIFVLTIFIKKFLKPLFQIIDGMKVVQTGDLTIQVLVENEDEIGYLGRSFNTMILNLKEIMEKNTELIRDVYEAQYLHKESQYNALCNQIKPHFLYNTLNTISLLIKCDEREAAIQSIENLSYFLRGIMNVDKDIPLQTELQITATYLEIQQIRYGDHLTFDIAIEPHLLSVILPALSLQPIVENAVKHGCEKKRGKTKISINSKDNVSELLIFVSDNGKGVPPEILEKIQTELNNDPTNSHPKYTENLESGIGLLNVSRRLKLKFGASAGVEILSDPSSGTEVIIHIPKK